MLNFFDKIHYYCFSLILVLLSPILSGCGVISQIQKTSRVIKENQQTIASSTETIADNASAVAESTVMIKRNAILIQQTNEALKDNLGVIEESTGAVEKNLSFISQTNQALEKADQNVASLLQTLKDNQWVLLAVAGFFLFLLILSPILLLVSLFLRRR